MKYVVEVWLERQARGVRHHYRVCLETGCGQIGLLRGETVSMPWTRSQFTEEAQHGRVLKVAAELGAAVRELDTIKTWRA